MSQKPLFKSPGETVRFDVDCTRRLDSTDTVVSIDHVSVLPLTSPTLDVTGSINTGTRDVIHPVTGLAYTVQGGKLISLSVTGGSAYSSKAARRYSVALSVTTAMGYHLEFVVPIEVVERPEPGALY